MSFSFKSLYQLQLILVDDSGAQKKVIQPKRDDGHIPIGDIVVSAW
jgi:hypothetical protein